MSEPFLAEIRMVGFNFAPRGWALCDGQILPINQNQSLYSLLGTTYGGDGRTSFALPDLRGRVPIHVGASNGTTHPQGQRSGEQTYTLGANGMPQHTHGLQASSAEANRPVPQGGVLADTPARLYGNPTALTNVRSGTVTHVGGGHDHNNMQPYIAINFCIALRGLFPSRD
jgi:microcystin-dependent protein